MEQFYLENSVLRITINQLGAEVSRILSKENSHEYLWNGDETYWKRHSPVIFPIVGSLKDRRLVIDGKDYPMSQHGFARDMNFRMTKQSNGKQIHFRLEDDDDTYRQYPYRFALEIDYELDGYRLGVNWRVINKDSKDMYFQIGAHPAFMCPFAGKGVKTDYYLKVDTDRKLKYSLLDENGLVHYEDNELMTNSGMIEITGDMFDRDALIFEDSGVTKVSLCTPDKMEYISVAFDAPLFGIWSPAGKNAPFICIEPWYGRADRADFSGDIREREYINCIASGESFEAKYYIEIGH